MKLDETATCSGAELSWLLGVTERAVRGYASKGPLARTKFVPATRAALDARLPPWAREGGDSTW
jgi:hypothetical protein